MDYKSEEGLRLMNEKLRIFNQKKKELITMLNELQSSIYPCYVLHVNEPYNCAMGSFDLHIRESPGTWETY